MSIAAFFLGLSSAKKKPFAVRLGHPSAFASNRPVPAAFGQKMPERRPKGPVSSFFDLFSEGNLSQ
jgi:hypothetical protein